MKRDAVMRVAIWMVEVSSRGPEGEAFAGDLLELFAEGRSRWWCLAQALRRAGSALERRLRSLVVPLGYCIGVVLLHPLWQRMYAASVAGLLTRYRGRGSWPGTAVLEIVAGLLPAVLFVWVGILVYGLLRRAAGKSQPIAAMLSLNVGVCLLLLAMTARAGALRYDLRLLSRADFFYSPGHGRFSMLLFLSLFGAVLVLSRDGGRSGRHQELARLLGWCGLKRVARRLGSEAFPAPQISA